MDVKISQMANAQVLEDSDFFPAVQGSINVKVTMAQVKSYIGSVVPSVSWSTVSDKPFASVSSADFTVSNDELAINPTIKSKFHGHSNKAILDKFAESSDGNVTYNGQSIAGVSAWSDISGKPFNTVSATDFKVVGNELQLSGSASGLDFTALSNALTTGTLSGLTITPDTANSNFDITVTGIPEIAIDAEGYWTINGERGENPTKARGEKGADGTNGNDGRGIISVEKTATSGLVDTYTITYTDETTSTFDVTNGASGSGGGVTLSDDITLAVASWDSSAKSQTISGLTIDVTKLNTPLPSVASLEEYASCGVYLAEETETSLTFKCKTVPTSALVLKIKSEVIAT